MILTKKKYERNGVETTVGSDGVLWLKEKHKEEWLDHKYLWVATVNYSSGYRKHRHEPIDDPVKQPNAIFIRKK